MSLKLPVAAAAAVVALSFAGAASACDTPGFLTSGKQALGTLSVSVRQAQAGSYTAAQAKGLQAYRQAVGSPMPCGADRRSARAHLLNGISVYIRGIGQAIGGHMATGNTMVGDAVREIAVTTEFLKNSHGR